MSFYCHLRYVGRSSHLDLPSSISDMEEETMSSDAKLTYATTMATALSDLPSVLS